jgi:cytochrome b561
MHAPSSNRYTVVAILLHWAIAALILFMIWLGWNMDDNEARFQLHKSIGISILFLSVARVMWRWLNPPPPLPDDMAPWEKRLSHGVHIGFYALMIGLPLLGWFLVSTSKFQVSTVLFGTVSWPHLPFTEGLRGGTLHEIAEFLHSKGAWVLIVLLGLHVAGAIKHEVAAEQGVFKRMIPGLFGRAHAPGPARGYVTAFGAALLLFAIIAAAPLMKSAPPAPAGPGVTGAVPEETSNWEIDPATSEIAFSGTYQNKPFSGTFARWDANVLFDPEDLEGSAVEVKVYPATASTGTKLYDDTLQGRGMVRYEHLPGGKGQPAQFRGLAGRRLYGRSLAAGEGHGRECPLRFQPHHRWRHGHVRRHGHAFPQGAEPRTAIRPRRGLGRR